MTPYGPLDGSFLPTDEQRRQVEKMKGMGLTHEEICCLITNPKTGRSISAPTLTKYFVRELERGKALLKSKVVGSLYRIAMDTTHEKCVTAAIWITKAQYGWTERHKVEVDAKVAGVLVAPAETTPEVWLREQAPRAVGNGEGDQED